MKLPTLACAVALMVLAPRALAADWYVDAVNGNNANSGATPADAWRTLTHTFQQAGPDDVVHVLAGVYDAAHGETFPFRPANGIRVVGVTGPAATAVSGTTIFELDYLRHKLTVEGITIYESQCAVRFDVITQACLDLAVRNCVLENCDYGLYFRTPGQPLFCHAVTLEDLTATGGISVVDADHDSVTDLSVTIRDSTIRGTGGAVVRVRAGGDSFDLVWVYSTRMIDCGSGLELTNVNTGNVYATIEDSLIGGCGRGITSDGVVVLRRSTVANSQQVGLESLPGTVLESILWGNGPDVGPGAAAGSFSYSDVGGGVMPGAGNLSVDPLFRAAEEGDYRLGWGTGCVDAIAGPTPPDLTGRPRGNDGDLDLVGAGDMGAFELRTLEAPETLPIGQKLHIDYHAEVGQFGVLFLARTTQLPTPIATPFGDQWLPPGFLELVGMQKVLTPHPVRRTIYIPDNPVLVGQAFSFQALSRSSNAPQDAQHRFLLFLGQ